jgi:hypothetical protein
MLSATLGSFKKTAVYQKKSWTTNGVFLMVSI